MYILYICILAPLIQNGFSLIGEETDLNPLSSYEDVDAFKENFEIWNADNHADVIVYDSISRLQLEEICKNVDTLVYITQEDITIDCKAFNNGHQPIDTSKNVIKRSVDDVVEGSASGPVDSNTEEHAHDEQINTTLLPSLESEEITTFDESEQDSIITESEPEKADETKDQDASQSITLGSSPIEETTINELPDQEDVTQNSESEKTNEANDEETTQPSTASISPEERTDKELTEQEISSLTPSDSLLESEKTENESSEQSTTSYTTEIENLTEFKEDSHNESQQESRLSSPIPTDGTQSINEQSVESVTREESTTVSQTEKPENKETNVEAKVEVPETDVVQKENGEYTETGDKDQWQKKDIALIGGRTLNFPEKNQKVQAEGTDGQNTEDSPQPPKKSGSKDTTILVFLFVAVVVVGALAFGYNFIKKRKRQSADLERVERTSTTKLSFQNLAKTDNEPEKKPLMSDVKEVEMVNMKKENSTPEQTPETTPNDLTVKT